MNLQHMLKCIGFIRVWTIAKLECLRYILGLESVNRLTGLQSCYFCEYIIFTTFYSLLQRVFSEDKVLLKEWEYSRQFSV